MATLGSNMARLGSATGTGLAQALEGYAQNKARQLIQDQSIDSLSKSMGVTRDQARILASDPRILLDFVQRGGLVNVPPAQSPTTLSQQIVEGNPALQQEMGLNEQSAPQQPDRFNQVFQQPTKKEAQEAEKINIKKEESTLKKNKDVREFSKPYEEARQKAENNIRDYRALINSARSGNLRAGAWKQVLNTIGLDEFSPNYDTQIAQKLIARLAQNVSGVFGQNSRLTNFLEQTFQRSLPSLWNSPEGIEAISTLNMINDEAQIALDDARKEYLKENNYLLGPDANDVIRQKAKPKLDALQDQAIRVAEGKPRWNFKGFSEKEPNVKELKGERVVFPDGSVRKSDGTKWVKEL